MKNKHGKVFKAIAAVLAFIGSMVMIYGIVKAQCAFDINEYMPLKEYVPHIAVGMVMMIVPGYFAFKNEVSEDEAK